MELTTKQRNFINELRALLIKYDAEITFEANGDTHGLSKERICIDGICENSNELLTLNEGWRVNYHNLSELVEEHQFLLDSRRGIYIPRDFAAMFPKLLTKEQRKDLRSPDNEWYWETWESVLNNLSMSSVLYFPTEYARLQEDEGDLYIVYLRTFKTN